MNAVITTTATIVTGTAGRTYLLVTIDGEPRCLSISSTRPILAGVTVTDEATRLLARHAGYTPTGEWKTNDNGDAIVDVTEIDGRCVTCVHGCSCRPTGQRGCGHHGCPAASATQVNTCPGAAIHVNARRTLPRFKRNTRRG